MPIQSIRDKALALLAIMAMVCAVGCRHSDDPDMPELPDMPDKPIPEMVNLCLQVSFDRQKEATRTDGADNDGYDYDISGEFEKISSLRVIIIRNVPNVDENGDTIKDINGKPETALRLVEANRLVATDEYGHPRNDNLEFNVVDNESKRIYLIANESSLQAPSESWASATQFLNEAYSIGTEVANFDNLTNWTVSMPDISDAGTVTDGLFSDSKALIPMLPLTEFFDIFVNVKRLNLPEDTYKSHLFITRAAAKATFYLDPTGLDPTYSNVQITSISLSGIGAEEYVFPNHTVYSKGKYQDAVKPDVEMYITDFKTPTDKTLTYLMDNLSINMVEKGTQPVTQSRAIHGPIYFPESILKGDEKYMVTVTLSTGMEFKAPLETNILNIDGNDAVARDTHLKIEMSFTPMSLTVEAIEAPYNSVSLNPGFGEIYYPSED
ncbi:MAG: hypothetical protein K2H49_07950 [Muribaculaceae bacterium]|nr:hypothetical protein [Muribaculaceae bacterium]